MAVLTGACIVNLLMARWCLHVTCYTRCRYWLAGLQVLTVDSLLEYNVGSEAVNVQRV